MRSSIIRNLWTIEERDVPSHRAENLLSEQLRERLKFSIRIGGFALRSFNAKITTLLRIFKTPRSRHRTRANKREKISLQESDLADTLTHGIRFT